MAKQKDQSDKRIQTRKQVARSRKEREQVRRVYLGLGLVAALIVIVLAIGLVQTYVLEPRSPVAVVNDQEITTGDYRTRVQYERFLLEDRYFQILQQQSALAQSENQQLAELLGSQYEQLAQQTLQQRSVVDRQTLDTMIEDVLIAEEAARREITVSEEEVDETINRMLAGRSGGLTAAAASETATARVNATATATLWTPTPTFTPTPTITATQEITPTATPIDTPTPGPTPTFNIIDESTLTTQYQEWLATLEDSAGIGEQRYREIIRKQVLRDKLAEELGNEVPKIAEQAHARHILVETEEEAQEVIQRLEAGEDFAQMAQEVSTDTGSGLQGGDLGFVPQGRFVAPVDEVVFSLPIGEISEPIQSDFGWHVIEVLEREERELSPVDYQQAQRSAFADWLAEARAEADIEDLWTLDSAPADEFLQQ